MLGVWAVRSFVLDGGELSLDQMAPVAKHAPAWCDEQMSGLAPRLSVAQVGAP